MHILKKFIQTGPKFLINRKLQLNWCDKKTNKKSDSFLKKIPNRMRLSEKLITFTEIENACYNSDFGYQIT